MRLATCEQSRVMDQCVERDFGVPGELAMEVAGALAARELEQSFFPELRRGRVVFVAGPGHNGADALVMARHLHGAGFRDLLVITVSKTKEHSPLLAKQLARLKSFGIPVMERPSVESAAEALRSSALLIDGLLGTGLGRALEKPFSSWVEVLNASSPAKISLDVPTGLDADTGKIQGLAVRATSTFTFGLAKPGFFTGSGPSVTGRLRVLKLGYPQRLIREKATTHFAFTEKLARRYLPRPHTSDNKSTRGFLQIFAGGEGMWGAAALSALGAFRMGAGYVQLASFSDPKFVVAQHPEIMTSQIDLASQIVHPKATALALGPGLGRSDEVLELLKKVKDQTQLPVLLDADALNFVTELGDLPPSWVITPHAGELARILEVSALDIEKNRFKYAQEAARKLGCVVLLKGFRTLIAFQKRVMVVLSGNSALAKAGTGDVLTGMTGALLASGLPAIQATGAAAYLHGRLADDWVKTGHDKLSMTASDLAQTLPELLARLRGESWTPL